MPKKKARITVDPAGHTDYAEFQYSSIKFAFVSPPNAGRKQCHSWNVCRDYLHEFVRASLHPGDVSCGQYDPEADAPIDTERLRIMVAKGFANDSLDKIKAKLFAGKRILNHYEALAGWSRSKITSINYAFNAKDKGRADAWLVTGPRQWMQSPHLLSMATLILRASLRLDDPITFKTADGLAKAWKKLANTNRSDAGYIGDAHKLFPLLMKHNKDLFKETMKKAYDPKMSSFHGSGGIVSLCDERSPLATLNKRIKALKKKHSL